MAAPFLLRGVSLLRRRLLHQNARLAFSVSTSQSISSSSAEPTLSDGGGSSAGQSTSIDGVSDSPKLPRWDELLKSKEIDEEIVKDIEPIIFLVKDILHSDRYEDGDPLTAEDEKVVVERLLSYHPDSEVKVGCGLHCIMVDRHPNYPASRCLFVVRRDGGYIDFSYKKCVRAYLQHKYPSQAEGFIEKYFKNVYRGPKFQ